MRPSPRDNNASVTWDARAAAHLLSRAALGGTPDEAARLAALPFAQAIDSLLTDATSEPAPSRPDWVQEPWINTERRIRSTTPAQATESHRLTRRRYSTELNQLRSWWVGRMITTPQPLREVMTLFWHSHFATATGKVMISQAIFEQNETFRRLGLGNFRDLLRAVTLDPAMMMYLDLEDSDKSHPNENYAREMCELFTVGIGNYTEPDVKEIARALTGWTLQAPANATTLEPSPPDTSRDFARTGLVATLDPTRHDNGVKTILGQTDRFGLDEVLDLIVQREATGRFLAAKLIDFFGVNDPENVVRDGMMAAFVAGHAEIKPVLRVLFTAPEFYAESSRGSLIKSPVRLLVGACRQLKLEVEPTPTLAQLTAAMGQELFNPPNVKGWPGGKAWIGAGTVAVRYHLPEALFDGREPEGLEPLGFTRFFAVPRDPAMGSAMVGRMEGAMADRRTERKKDGLKCRFIAANLFPQGVPAEPSALVDSLLNRLVVTTVRPGTRTALIEACASVSVEDRPSLIARLILASPEYQLA